MSAILTKLGWGMIIAGGAGALMRGIHDVIVVING